MHGPIRPQELRRGSTLAAGKSLRWDPWPQEFLRALLWLWASAPRVWGLYFFFCHGNMGAGQDSRSDICLTCRGVGRQPGHASGPGTWKQFQVLHFRHHNRSVKHFYPQVHFERYMYTNSAGTHPDYLSICTRKQPEADQPKNRECR